MPSDEEIREVLIVQARMFDPKARVDILPCKISALAGGNTSVPLIDDEALLSMNVEVYPDVELAKISYMVTRANDLPHVESHAKFWRVYNHGRVLMAVYSYGEWMSLLMDETARKELVRCATSPDELIGGYENGFRLMYRTLLNFLALDESDDKTLPDRDTATVESLSPEHALVLEVSARQMTNGVAAALTKILYEFWGEAGYARVKHRLTPENFIARAQTPHATS